VRLVRLLGWDTATRATAVAALDTEHGLVAEERDDPPPGQRPAHAAALLPAAEAVLQRAGWDWGDLDRLAVGVGPGSFTGLRIGLAAARGAALARGLELAGVSSLRALAAAAEAEAELVLAVLDARRGEVFAAGWRDGAEVVIAPAALAPAALAERVRTLPGRPLAVGDGAVAFRPDMHAAGAVVPEDASPLHRVRAEWICRLGAGAGGVDPATVLPDYLRPPDATPRAGRPRP
jgi:tRNA threonylcarbamoyladenosine biosynthesis protein TsaB